MKTVFRHNYIVRTADLSLSDYTGLEGKLSL